MDENMCVCCGESIPEGRMICYKCENMEAEKAHSDPKEE